MFVQTNVCLVKKLCKVIMLTDSRRAPTAGAPSSKRPFGLHNTLTAAQKRGLHNPLT